MYAAYATRPASSGLTVGESAAICVLKEGSSADHATNSSPLRPLPQGEESARTRHGTTANVLTPKRRERWKNILRSHTQPRGAVLIDFKFVREEVAHCYGSKGNVAVTSRTRDRLRSELER